MGALYRDRVWQNKKLKGGRLLVMLALADHADDDGECYPGMVLLMEKTRLTDRQLRRVLNGLDTDGLISIEERAIGRGKRPHYKLFPQEKADILSEEKRTFVPPLEEKADISDNKSGHFVHEKADISGANYSHVRREPKAEPTTEPERESAPARRISSPHLDPRRFVNGRIPPGKGTTPVEVYYERFDINDKDARLNAIKEDDLQSMCPDLDKLRAVVTAYSQTPFQLGNLKLILDWYQKGIPDKHKVPSSNGVHKNGAVSEAQKSAILTRAKTASGNIRTAQKFNGVIDPQWERDIEAARELGLPV